MPWQYFVEMFNINFYTNQPVLLLFNARSFGAKLEKWTDAAILANATYVLKKLYPTTFVPYSKYVITRWKSDPYSLGSYSYSKVGAVQPNDRNSLAAPVSGRLFFAGEHTSALYPATVHGAYLSGLAAAAGVMGAPTSVPVAMPVAPAPSVVYATATVNTGQTLAQMQAPAFAAAFKAGVESSMSGVTCTVTSVTGARRLRRQLLAAATVSFTATSTSVTASTMQVRPS